jgi:GNAT superfamily N-acetyltransferase
VESLYDVSREIAPLFVRFWQESGKHDVPLDPDWEALLRLTALGFLRVVTVRDKDMLVGFILNVVGQPHLMYRSTPHGTTLAYWLSPEFRRGWFPVKLFRQNLDLLREWGCRRVFIAADAGYKNGRMGRVFERLGYRILETSYAAVF